METNNCEMTFRSSSPAAICPTVHHTRWRLHTAPFNTERQVGEAAKTTFIVFGIVRPGILHKFAVVVAVVSKTLNLQPAKSAFRLDAKDL